MSAQHCYERVPRGAELRSLLSYIVQLIADLESVMTSLPHVAEDGSSDCPFAKELYVKKQKLEQEVAFWLQELHRFLAYLKKEVERCLQNLDRIRSDARRLNLEETRRCYSEAETEQEREYRHAVQDRDAVYIVLKKAEAVLEVSSTRKFPGGVPKETSGLSAPGSHSSGNFGSAVSSEERLGGELDGLMSLEPLN